MIDMAKKRGSQASLLLTYVATMLICIILFGTCAVVLLDVFVTQPAKKKQDALNGVSSSDEDAAVDYSYANETILFVGANGETLNAVALVRVKPQDGAVLIVPISKYTVAKVGDTSGTISELFESGGMAYLKRAVENVFSVKCDKYLKITDEGWKSLVEYTGGTSDYTFPEELMYKNEATGELTSFSAGQATRTLWGDDIRRIITYPLYSEGEKTRVQVIGELSTCLINSAFTSNAADMKANLTNIFNTIFNNSDTDITTKSFKEVREAYEYLLDNAKSPATYRMPRGTWGQNGYFTVDSEFVGELKDYFGIE